MGNSDTGEKTSEVAERKGLSIGLEVTGMLGETSHEGGCGCCDG